jgi:hypothetical protein
MSRCRPALRGTTGADRGLAKSAAGPLCTPFFCAWNSEKQAGKARLNADNCNKHCINFFAFRLHTGQSA